MQFHVVVGILGFCLNITFYKVTGLLQTSSMNSQVFIANDNSTISKINLQNLVKLNTMSILFREKILNSEYETLELWRIHE